MQTWRYLYSMAYRGAITIISALYSYILIIFLVIIHRDAFNWHRGILKVIMGNEATVHYVDYGITGVIDIKDVRLDTSLEDIPVKVLRCSLYTLNSL